MTDKPFASRDDMLNALLDEEIRAHRRPGMTVGQLGPLLPPEVQTLYYQRKVREWAELNGMNPDS